MLAARCSMHRWRQRRRLAGAVGGAGGTAGPSFAMGWIWWSTAAAGHPARPWTTVICDPVVCVEDPDQGRLGSADVGPPQSGDGAGSRAPLSSSAVLGPGLVLPVTMGVAGRRPGGGALFPLLSSSPGGVEHGRRGGGPGRRESCGLAGEPVTLVLLGPRP